MKIRQKNAVENIASYLSTKGKRRAKVNELVRLAVRKFKLLQQRAFLRRPLKDVLTELNGAEADDKKVVEKGDVISMNALTNWQKQQQV